MNFLRVKFMSGLKWHSYMRSITKDTGKVVGLLPSSLLTELIAEYWGAHRYFPLCETNLNGIVRYEGLEDGEFWLFFVSSFTFYLVSEGCQSFVDCTIGSFCSFQ